MWPALHTQNSFVLWTWPWENDDTILPPECFDAVITRNKKAGPADGITTICPSRERYNSFIQQKKKLRTNLKGKYLINFVVVEACLSAAGISELDEIEKGGWTSVWVLQTGKNVQPCDFVPNSLCYACKNRAAFSVSVANVSSWTRATQVRRKNENILVLNQGESANSLTFWYESGNETPPFF